MTADELRELKEWSEYTEFDVDALEGLVDWWVKNGKKIAAHIEDLQYRIDDANATWSEHDCGI